MFAFKLEVRTKSVFHKNKTV